MTTDLSRDAGAGAGHVPTVSTRILHADRIADAGHGAVHAPMHTSVLYGYGSAQELQEVFQGHKPGFTYARQGNPTGAALEAKLADGGFYVRDPKGFSAATARLDAARIERDAAEHQWLELEMLREEIEA